MMPITGMTSLLILGFGGHARSLADVAIAAGVSRLLFLEPLARAGEGFAGFQAVTSLPANLTGEWFAFPASGDNARREDQCVDAPFPLTRLVSPDATVGLEAEIGEATFLARHAHVGPLTRIGRGVILNTGSITDHESVVGDFSHISVNATVAGRCRIGRRVMLGAGATVIDAVTVCDDVTIGAGAAVVADITEPGTYVGVPARRIA